MGESDTTVVAMLVPCLVGYNKDGTELVKLNSGNVMGSTACVSQSKLSWLYIVQKDIQWLKMLDACDST